MGVSGGLTMFEDIRARADAATAGPWKVKYHNEDYGQGYGETTFYVSISDELFKIGIADNHEKYAKYGAISDFIAYAREDIPALLDALEAKERELAEYRTAEEQGSLIRLPCKVGGDIYWINGEEKCVGVHKNGIRGIVVRNGEFAIEDTDGYIDVAGTKYCYLTREEAERALKGGE